jgi:4-hydroxybenzoate polyprenyltransferase
VAGFDIIYSVQDEVFDRAQGLRSIPASLGTRRALGVARLFHFLAVLGFAGIWFLFPLGWLYLGGVGVMAVLLHFGHAGLRGRDADQLDLLSIDRAFFRVNVGVSTGCLLFTLLDRVFLG